jgi:hypothetical protein
MVDTRTAVIVSAVLTIGDVAMANAKVDAGDYIVWRKNYGYDCNGDRRIDANDYAIWRSRLRAVFSANLTSTDSRQWKGADLNCDGRVDAADYLVWRKATGR